MLVVPDFGKPTTKTGVCSVAAYRRRFGEGLVRDNRFLSGRNSSVVDGRGLITREPSHTFEHTAIRSAPPITPRPKRNLGPEYFDFILEKVAPSTNVWYAEYGLRLLSRYRTGGFKIRVHGRQAAENIKEFQLSWPHHSCRDS